MAYGAEPLKQTFAQCGDFLKAERGSQADQTVIKQVKELAKKASDSYEDFKENYRVNVPENFNFGFDIVDEWAKQEPQKKALVWCNDNGDKKEFTFTDISKLSNQTANYFKSIGIKKGSVVMLILRRRWEYWICATAIHKIGAILIPGSLQLSKKDLIYRGNSANIHTIICVDDPYVIEQVEAAKSSLEKNITAGDAFQMKPIHFQMNFHVL